MSDSAEKRVLRSTERIDYQVLHKTGEKILLTDASASVIEEVVEENSSDNNSRIEKVSEIVRILNERPSEIPTLESLVDPSLKSKVKSANRMSQEIEILKTQQESLHDDILDYMEENPINHLILVEDIDNSIRRVEDFRARYRSNHKDISRLSDQADNVDYKKEFEETMGLIKEYIVNGKEKRIKIRSHHLVLVDEEKTKQEKKELEEFNRSKQTAEFLLIELDRIIKELSIEVTQDLTNEAETEILNQQGRMPSIQKRINDLSHKFQNLLSVIPDSFPDKTQKITHITTEYNKLLKEHVDFKDKLQSEVDRRELKKEETFEVSKLKIQLPKFKGYESMMDVYTFQEKFDNLCVKSTPKRLLPELLKNNYLEGPALDHIKRLNDIDEIWVSLKQAFGDPRMMLMKKLTEIESIGPLYRIKDSEKLKNTLSKVVNVMDELMRIAKAHRIESKLYNGDGIYSIYKILGDVRITKWLYLTCDKALEGEDLWKNLVEFIDKEIKINLEKSMIYRNLRDKDSVTNKLPGELTKGNITGGKERKSALLAEGTTKKDQTICSFCGKDDHVASNGPYGKKLIQYFSCKKFAELPPVQRHAELMKKKLCTQCLFPGAQASTGKHVEGKCQNIYTCKHNSHDSSIMKKHVLVCDEHRKDTANKSLLEEYRSRCIKRNNTNLPDFAKSIQVSFLSNSYSTTSAKRMNTDSDSNDDAEVIDNGIFIFQKICVEDKQFNLFFDGGCGDLVSRYDAVMRLGQNAKKETDGPISLGGVGNMCIESPYGTYQICLPLHNGRKAIMSGTVIDEVSSEFPTYPLHQVQMDIEESYVESGGCAEDLPKLPHSVGGPVDIMLGIKYLRYHPQKVFSMPSGLTIYRSPFLNVDGSRGVVGGPHETFTAINNHYSYDEVFMMKSFLSQQALLYKRGYLVNPDMKFLEWKCPKDNSQELLLNLEDENCCKGKNCSCLLVSRNQKLFNTVEDAGSEITYRCVKCRDCHECKNGEKIEFISMKEEVEQAIISKSVIVDLEKNITTAHLPFLEDPVLKLKPNIDKAKAVYGAQLRKLNKDEKSKDDVIKSEGTLQSLGYVDYVRNLSEDTRNMLNESVIKNYIPWRSVWNSNSLSTPCRVVFDASAPTKTGKSLNDVLAKGPNHMNKLVEILIHWSAMRVGFHADLSKMYNSVKLRDEDWCFQRYLWQEDLNAEVPPEEKVIKTLIYGVKSSGKQSEIGLRQTALLQKEDYPRANSIIQDDVYVDDCISGESTTDLAFQSADELEAVANRGGFKFKGFTFTGMPPQSELSSDGDSINVAGLKWYSEDDMIQLDISKLNFAKKHRGRKPEVSVENRGIPKNLTRRHCTAKVAEIYDITGKITPITAAMKLDLHDLIKRNLQWDDIIPDDLRGVWNSHFEMMEEINSIRFNRTIIPDDAVSLKIETLDTGDASKSIACVAIYARIQRRNGEFSCQLVFSRSKLVPDGTTQPRAELIAAVLNSHTGEVVKRSFGDLHTKATKFTDNQIVLHWINNNQKALKQWVRTRIIEIRRYTDKSQWYYVESSQLIADLGTRRGAKLSDVNKDSTWIKGYEWMRKDEASFPVKSVDKLKLDAAEKECFKKEMFSPFQDEDLTSFEWPHSEKCFMTQTDSYTQRFLHEEIAARYEFSQYIIDPNQRKFSTVVRIVAIVLKFVKSCQNKACQRRVGCILIDAVPEESSPVHSVMLTDDEIGDGRNYFYRKATQEVKRFARKSDYDKISTERNGILYYTGRIMPEQNIQAVSKMTDVMKDLSSTTFFVPLVEMHSPIAYSIVNEVHWYHKTAKHSGVETVHRYTMQLCYILRGRNLVKLFRKTCERCRYLAKRTIDIEMGPVSRHNVTIAPAFYVTQLDIAGPFLAYSPHNKRTTVKVWFVVYCCCTTSTVNIKVMEGYDTSAFLQSFIRFSCETGYPKLLISDEGSQLLKGYDDMRINFSDLKNKLHIDMSIEFEITPIGGHNMSGKVERMIREVKESVTKSFAKERLSILQWETVGAEVSNSLNNLPLALGSIVSDFENMDLITPNRLRLGRNNERSPTVPLYVTSDPNKFLEENTKIFNGWFENWLISHVPKLMNHPKWFKTDYHLKEGDIVLFLKKEGLLNKTYQYGMVKSTELGRDGKIRTVVVKYRNHNEKVDRETRRAVRQLVMIHRVDELNIIHELGEISVVADMKKKLTDTCN